VGACAVHNVDVSAIEDFTVGSVVCAMQMRIIQVMMIAPIIVFCVFVP
jgi:hypothetical protein